MSEFHIAVVEDSQDDYQRIHDALNRFFSDKDIKAAISRFTSGEAFLSTDTRQYDLVFMDIMLGEKNGMDTAREMRKNNEETLLIFLTNMSQYAIEGYSVKAMDYILKPVNYFSLVMKLEWALALMNRKKDSLISVRNGDGKTIVNTEDIYYVEVMGHDIFLHCKEEVITTYGVLKEYEETLKKFHFSRCSATALINLSQVKGLAGDEVLLKDNTHIPIGRSKKKAFLSDLSLYLGGNL